MAAETPTFIEPSHLYSLDEAKRRLGWGADGFRRARHLGLKVIYHGRHAYVLGQDLIDFITQQGKEER